MNPYASDPKFSQDIEALIESGSQAIDRYNVKNRQEYALIEDDAYPSLAEIEEKMTWGAFWYEYRKNRLDLHLLENPWMFELAY